MGRHKRIPGEHKRTPTSHKVERPKRKRRVGPLAMAIVMVGAMVPAAAYTIKPGDTLGQIARDHNTTVRRLATLNGIKNPDVIYAGDRIRIRKKGDRRVKARVSRSSRRVNLDGPIPAAGSWRWHSGYPNPAVDVNIAGSSDCGNPVRAAATGQAFTYYWTTSYGKHVRVGGTLYAHLSEITVPNGSHVLRGQVIGRVGQSGNATGCHLHYEYGR